MLLRLFEISRRFNMPVQPQLILLQKTLLNIEGLGRDLYPELDIWKTASPILRDWMRERTSVRSVFKNLREHWPQLIEAARNLPGLLTGIARRAQNGNLSVQVQAPGVEALQVQGLLAGRRRDKVIIVTAVLVGALLGFALAVVL